MGKPVHREAGVGFDFFWESSISRFFGPGRSDLGVEGIIGKGDIKLPGVELVLIVGGAGNVPLIIFLDMHEYIYSSGRNYLKFLTFCNFGES